MQLNFRATHVTYNLQKVFVPIRTEEIMPPPSLLNNFQAFLKPVTLFNRTWDIQ